MTRTLIAAHRGGTDLWPENSLLAFRKTAGMPVDLVEFDVHRTRDGVLVVHHDSTIDRMTDGAGAIAGMDFSELSRFVVKGTGGERIPTLAEAVEVFRRSPVDLRLEIKTGPNFAPYDGIEAEIVAELAEAGMIERTLLTSFMLPILSRFRLAASGRGRLGEMWLVSPLVLACSGLEGVIAAARAHDIAEIGLHAADLDAEVVAAIREAGLVPHGWAAHKREAAERMFALGVAGFTTDRPDLALAVKP